MGFLRQIKGRTNWYFQAWVNNRLISWSTGEINYRRALAKKPELEVKAQLLREQHAASSNSAPVIMLAVAVQREVERLKTDAGIQQSERVDYALDNFVKWLNRDIPIRQISMEMLEEFQRARLKQVAEATVDKELIYIIRALKHCGHIVAKPSKKPGKKTVQRAFTPAELEAFFKACEVYPQEEPGRYLTLFLTMLATGARPAEMVFSKRSGHKPLLKSEVDPKRKIVTVRPSKLLPGKKAEPPRDVPVQDELIKALQAQIARMPKDWPYVFAYRTNLHRLFGALLKKAKIPKTDALGRKLTAHCFRHTYGTDHQSKTKDLYGTMKAMGHKQVSTTLIYMHNEAPQLSMDLGRFLKNQSEEGLEGENFMGEGI